MELERSESEAHGLLHPNSTVALMKKRLKELSCPVYGTKAQLWTRLEEAEKLQRDIGVLKQEMTEREEQLTRNPGGAHRPMMIPGVTPPTPQEREIHELTHCDFQSWCEVCQRAKGRDNPHHGLKNQPRSRGTSSIVMDFGIFDTDDAGNAHMKADEFATTLVIADNDTGYPAAISTPSKAERSLDFMCEMVCRFITLMRHDTVEVHCDNEPAIIALQKAIQKKRLPQVTRLTNTPLYSSESNGRAERAIQSVRRQTVALKLATELSYGIALSANMALWPWMTRHSAWLLARFHLKTNGRTYYEELHDSRYKSQLVPFAETVLFLEVQQHDGRMQGGKRRHKAESVMQRGIVLGRSEEADDIYIGTPAGVRRVRTIRRLEPAKRSDTSLLLSIRGAPWNLLDGATRPSAKEKAMKKLPATAQPIPIGNYQVD
jgi:hypothetical protein